MRNLELTYPKKISGNRKVVYVNVFFHCLIYLALIGFDFFIIGRVLSKERFSFEEFPFCSFLGERQISGHEQDFSFIHAIKKII